ncbi:MAG: NAD(P)-binding domain-containing protein [Candidatus Acidiferrales bacterium]
MSTCDVAIIGAGPYGLSAAAHLRSVKGLDVRVFGQPMSFWDRQMPRGMLLRSNWTATQIAAPDSCLSIEAFQRASAVKFYMPVPLECFVEYGKWYQGQAVPDLDPREVDRIEIDINGFSVILQDGEVFHSRRVIVAAGIGSFASRPPEFRNLPSSLVSHTSEHRDLRNFAGRRVLIIGGGQSALESAALLREAGGEPEVITRSPKIHWLQGWASKTLHHRLGGFVRQLLYAPTDVGPAGVSQLLARPDLVRRLPRSLQDRLRQRAVRPAGARWLVDRLRDVPISLGCSVKSVGLVGEQVRVRLDDARERIIDHVLLGTGYRVDISKYAFLSGKLKGAVRCFNGYPVLGAGLETSVPGLHILGAPAAWSFGPLMQFVSGTHYASQALTRHIGGPSSAGTFEALTVQPALSEIPQTINR